MVYELTPIKNECWYVPISQCFGYFFFYMFHPLNNRMCILFVNMRVIH